MLTVYRLLITDYRSPLTAYCLPLTAYRPPATGHYPYHDPFLTHLKTVDPDFVFTLQSRLVFFDIPPGFPG